MRSSAVNAAAREAVVVAGKPLPPFEPITGGFSTTESRSCEFPQCDPNRLSVRMKWQLSKAMRRLQEHRHRQDAASESRRARQLDSVSGECTLTNGSSRHGSGQPASHSARAIAGFGMTKRHAKPPATPWNVRFVIEFRLAVSADQEQHQTVSCAYNVRVASVRSSRAQR